MQDHCQLCPNGFNKVDSVDQRSDCCLMQSDLWSIMAINGTIVVKGLTKSNNGGIKDTINHKTDV